MTPRDAAGPTAQQHKADTARTVRPRWAPFWINAALALVVAESAGVIDVAKGRPGGTLSETVWWLYGDPGSLQWTLSSAVVNGLLSWAMVHFMVATWGPRELAWHMAGALVLHVAFWTLAR